MVLSAVRPVTIGPTWQRDAAGFVLPEFSLGPQIIEWCWWNLLIPDGDRAGERWEFTKEQARFLQWWYAIDEQGQFSYRNGVLRRMKGWGKDPFGAVLCAVEFVGPSHFGGWRDGKPVVIPHKAAWVQVAAVSLDQTRSTMTLFPALFTKACIKEHEIDIGKEKIYAYRGARRIEALSTASRTQEGMRPSFVIANEPHHWLKTNDGHSMRETLDRNLAKGRGRLLAITNAHRPGENSVAEKDFEAYKSGTPDLLYDSLEAPADTILSDDESLMAGLEAARGDSYWVPLDRIFAEIRDPRTPASLSRRFYLNQETASEDAWCTPQQWDALARDYVVSDKAQVTLGFDGSSTSDHTALVLCEVDTGHLALLGHWDPEKSPDGRIPSDKVDALVHQVFAKYDVVGFFADTREFNNYIDQWAQEFGANLCVHARAHHAIAWQMGGGSEDSDDPEASRTKLATHASMRFLDAIIEGFLTHDGNATFAQHVKNARSDLNRYGIVPVKETNHSSRKIDALDAAILAWECRKEYLLLPDNKKRQVLEEVQIF